jgi:hypothetical protein
MLKKIVVSIKIYNLEKGVFMSFEKEPHERILAVAGFNSIILFQLTFQFNIVTLDIQLIDKL